jgi:hypothetical protein
MGLADRLGKSGVIASCAEPGLAATNLQVTSASDGGMGSSMWIMRMAQSQEDGSMPIAAACFDPTTTNGSMWQPKNMGAMKGPAIKVEMDKLSTNEASRKLLWEKSEEACGIFEMN